MPSPTVGDPWLQGRHFGIVIDAGSSGSRLQIYSWKSPEIALRDDPTLARTLPHVEKGTKDPEEWIIKVTPGISSFAENPKGVAEYLRPLLAHALQYVPPTKHRETPLFLLATAGMRLLPRPQQKQVLEAACLFLTRHSDFHLPDCGPNVRIITGEEEGLFGWIAVNYLMDGFVPDSSSVDKEGHTTYGFLDMGGASTQIAFEPSKAYHSSLKPDSVEAKALKEVKLRLLNGEVITHNVFVTTWLGYGTNQARERYVAKAIEGFHSDSHKPIPAGDKDIISDPCLPKNLHRTETPIHHAGHAPSKGSLAEHLDRSHQLVGTGSFQDCLRESLPLLNKTMPCPDDPDCLLNDAASAHNPHAPDHLDVTDASTSTHTAGQTHGLTPLPPINFASSHFIGVSEYWYASQQAFGLGGVWDYDAYVKAAQDFCARDWDEILKEHDHETHDHDPDGETKEERDKALTILQMQCFKAAWIVNVLHEGIGMPRVLGGPTTAKAGPTSTPKDATKVDGEAGKVVDKAAEKGLGPLTTENASKKRKTRKKRPAFQSMETVGDIAISWTLGKMVLEASKEVHAHVGGSPVKSDKSPVGIEDKTGKINVPPASVPEHSDDHLEVEDEFLSSDILLSGWFLMFIVLLVIGWPLRKRLRMLCMGILRRFGAGGNGGSRRREKDMFMMEEGGAGFGGGRSTLLGSVSRALSSAGSTFGPSNPSTSNGSASYSSYNNNNNIPSSSSLGAGLGSHGIGNTTTIPTRGGLSPRSMSFQQHPVNGNGLYNAYNHNTPIATTTASSISRSGSPVPGVRSDPEIRPAHAVHGRSGSIGALARSRNSSQVNLAALGGGSVGRSVSRTARDEEDWA